MHAPKNSTAFQSIVFLFIMLFLLQPSILSAQETVKQVPVDSGWANNSVNAVVFRKNSLVTFGNTQYIAFYDKNSFLVIGKRSIGKNQWQLKRSSYTGNTADAHNTISIMVDGAGYLHVSWDHHNNPLRYAKTKTPGSLELSEKISMTGKSENRVSYPEFYKLPGGKLLFFYRDGASGQGNLVINQYDIKTKKWTQLHNNLIDGERQRNAYWQACVDKKGVVHLSWVWRESPDVASNHDLCYAKSTDGGKTWQHSSGENYHLPITQASAEYAWRIPQKSELINQTSMCADDNGMPFIATYWRELSDSIPQYHLVYQSSDGWQSRNLGFRKTAFSLSGGGTKAIPISRPQVLAWRTGQKDFVAFIFRDSERGNKVSIAVTDLKAGDWMLKDLTSEAVGAWEPTYDTELWREKKRLHLFLQNVEQLDAEGKANIPPQMVKVLQWTPPTR